MVVSCKDAVKSSVHRQGPTSEADSALSSAKTIASQILLLSIVKARSRSSNLHTVGLLSALC